MFGKSLLNTSKNVQILIPTFRTGVNRYASNSDICNPCCDENDDKVVSTQQTDQGNGVENGINDQINRQLTALYTHIAMAEYYSRTTIGLLGFAKSHSSQVKEELCLVKKLMAVLSQKGGNLSLKAIEPPNTQQWDNTVNVEKAALQLQKSSAKGLMELQNAASKAQDHHVSNTINASVMPDLMKQIFELEKRQAKLELCSSPGCLFLIDNSLLNSK